MSDEPVKILLVDDNPHDARLIKEMLSEVETLNFTIQYAERLEDALISVAKNSFDVVLLDLMLPDSQGLDTFLRMYEKAPWLPTVVLTGLSDETMAANAVREGAQDYLVKGQVDGNILVKAMRFAIERRRQSIAKGAKRAPAERPSDTNLKLIGTSDGLKEVEEFIATVSKTSNTSVPSYTERPAPERALWLTPYTIRATGPRALLSSLTAAPSRIPSLKRRCSVTRRALLRTPSWVKKGFSNSLKGGRYSSTRSGIWI